MSSETIVNAGDGRREKACAVSEMMLQRRRELIGLVGQRAYDGSIGAYSAHLRAFMALHKVDAAMALLLIGAAVERDRPVRAPVMMAWVVSAACEIIESDGADKAKAAEVAAKGTKA